MTEAAVKEDHKMRVMKKASTTNALKARGGNVAEGRRLRKRVQQLDVELRRRNVLRSREMRRMNFEVENILAETSGYHGDHVPDPRRQATSTGHDEQVEHEDTESLEWKIPEAFKNCSNADRLQLYWPSPRQPIPSPDGQSHSTASPGKLSASTKTSRTDKTSLPCVVCPAQTSQCIHYPCVQPTSYTSLGFGLAEHFSVEEIRGRAGKVPGEDLVKRILFDPKFPSIRRPTGGLTYDVKARQANLRERVDEMRRKNERYAPKDYTVNYGVPIPNRSLTKPLSNKNIFTLL